MRIEDPSLRWLLFHLIVLYPTAWQSVYCQLLESRLMQYSTSHQKHTRVVPSPSSILGGVNPSTIYRKEVTSPHHTFIPSIVSPACASRRYRFHPHSLEHAFSLDDLKCQLARISKHPCFFPLHVLDWV